MPQSPTTILFVKDLAKILEMTEDGVRRMRTRGELPLRRFGRRWGILESDFSRWARIERDRLDCEPAPPVRHHRSKYLDVLRGSTPTASRSRAS